MALITNLYTRRYGRETIMKDFNEAINTCLELIGKMQKDSEEALKKLKALVDKQK